MSSTHLAKRLNPETRYCAITMGYLNISTHLSIYIKIVNVENVHPQTGELSAIRVSLSHVHEAPSQEP